MAFTSIAALAAGEAVSATLVLGAMAEIGTAMTIVGGVTGSKELMKIGGTMAMVGGVGGMVNGAIGSAASTAVDGVATTVADEAATQLGADQFASSMAESANPFQAMGDMGTTQGFGDVAGATGQTGSATMQDAAKASLPGAESSVTQVAPNASASTSVMQASPSVTDVNTPVDTSPASTGMANNPSAASSGNSNVRNLLLQPQNRSDPTEYLNSFMGWAKETMGKQGNLGGAMMGAAKAFEAERNYNLQKDRQGLIAGQIANQSKIANFKYGA